MTPIVAAVPDVNLFIWKINTSTGTWYAASELELFRCISDTKDNQK